LSQSAIFITAILPTDLSWADLASDLSEGEPIRCLQHTTPLITEQTLLSDASDDTTFVGHRARQDIVNVNKREVQRRIDGAVAASTPLASVAPMIHHHYAAEEVARDRKSKLRQVAKARISRIQLSALTQSSFI
jgi:hypothetical protein